MENKIELITMLEKLPPFPSHVQQIANFLNDDKNDWRAVGKIVLKDPVLAGRILQIANSSFYGLQRKIKDIDMACAVLGIETLRNLVHTLIVMSRFKHGHEKSLIDYNLLWRNNLRIACMVRVLASKFNQEPSIFFIIGLFHTLDLVVQDYFFSSQLLQRIKSSLKLVEITEDIKIYQIINTDYWWMIATLLEYWHFPEKVVEFFKQQKNTPPIQSITILLMCSEIVKQMAHNKNPSEVISTVLLDFDQDNPALARNLEWGMQDSQTMYEDLVSLMLNDG